MTSSSPAPSKPAVVWDDDTVKARLAAIVASSSDAIVAKDLNSIITDWNPAAERMFGYTPEEAIGRDVRMLIPDHLWSEEEEIIRRIKASERIESYETVRRRKNGELIQVSLTVSPILATSGLVVGASKIARDITAAKENERRIRLLLREINHRVKNQYAVILSLIRETGRTSQSKEEWQSKVEQRIWALAAAHDLLVATEWTGSGVSELIDSQLASFPREKVVALGPDVMIQPTAVQNLAMALHELCTNSAKYGVISGRPGRVEISWSLIPAEPRQFTLSWEEHFDEPLPPAPNAPSGFGSTVLSRVVPRALQGEATTRREDRLVSWVLTAPAEFVVVAD